MTGNITMTLRPLNSSERELLERLLTAVVPGQNELRLQLKDSQVEPIDSNGSLRFKINSDIVAPVARRIPVEAQRQDNDGMWIHALLHVIDGKLSELEIYKDDSSPVIRMPTQDEWQLMVLD
jgi:hypothetical protein